MREELKRLMEARGWSQSHVARALGISGAALSQWLDGKYKGDVKRINEAVKAFLKREQERLQTPKKLFPFVLTSNAQKVFETARFCHIDGEIGLVIGEAGTGKTTAVKEYARQNPDVILVEADLGYTTRVLFRELHKAVGYDGEGLIHDMFTDVVEKLKDSGRLIIVDEAEHLPYRALELLRRVYDKAGIGILLVGMPRLLTNLRGKRGDYAQLYSRVGIATKLQAVSAVDVQAFTMAVFPESNGIWQEFYKQCQGSVRTLTKLILRTARIAELNHNQVSKSMVQRAAETLII
ncbi:transcriptional regulator, XRE family [Caldithrix abyssi DSM 13497]|uniref:Helix-turn-helix domain-containing protein n=1 Tax=Caldithrix abyssi DSM 13497 TaxID=880073 RepID=H1XTG2_CALAY|nr:AAA family ATPase [Caldithrix abyssi]APF16967.1 Helix-turn-helix domain-containing protein [Caldithrix abyssi DSM 13497]APF20344.1 Helix-turn-helix domain-containing protein [Caldithrix abyssi DSM 13497]EHO40395.1 transcriptional regulator, XRE family [Caldithrix abyssi DSM 13497]EHO41123.1 transcriptional regulator, XRE family [Caldithrix abyssi DSM 13497]